MGFLRNYEPILNKTNLTRSFVLRNEFELKKKYHFTLHSKFIFHKLAP